MKAFNNLKIRTKLILSFAIVIVLVAIVSAFGVVQMTTVDDNYSFLLDWPVKARVETMNFRVAWRDARIQTVYMSTYAVSNDTNAIEDHYRQAVANIADAREALDVYDSYISTNPRYNDADRKLRLDLTKNIRTNVDYYSNNVIPAVHTASLEGDTETAVAALTSQQALDAIASILADANQTLDLVTGIVDEVSNQSSAAADFAVTLLLATAAAIVVLSILLAMFISSMISKPINRMVDVANNVAQGNLNINIDTSSKDETGMLAKSFSGVVTTVNTLVKELVDLSHKNEVEGDIEARIDSSHFSGAYKEVADNVNAVVNELVSETLNFMNCTRGFADGDFSADMALLPGKKRIMNETLDSVRNNLQSVNKDIASLVNSAIDGNLALRADANAYKGDWVKLIGGLNNLMEAVAAPINESVDVLKYVSNGNFENKLTGNYKGEFLVMKDSINTTVANISSYIEEISKVLTNLSRNDLNQEITREYVGSFSEIKEALNNIINTLNKVIGDMNSASEQVAAGAKQISESSMTLAQGATEQASSVQELTATVMSVNEKTQNNAENSVRATELSQELMNYAVEGNTQMKDMLKSMQAITEASNSISKIIEIIKDISFQTNLLALNASIEAAHAGVHGAGFSVVAEEVRDLAVKSQEAAANTTELIETSIHRVNEGTDIAVKTDQALEKIVSGVTHVSTIISGISEASGEQAMAISQINDGVSQIAQVVQDNSATSEESAAAAEELSSQAELMRNMVSVFKMKGSYR